ncbi:hypothetical protein P1P75_41905 [Streptomyces sp. ID05-39B]|uniref:hypothetical protein n=1 Tax=Streptomyces sp. ID05-39B TaxID=3028664 RepID=UPI0029B5434D|nr:hypothetical protein [Streptomyces sp. ID05-39B]MDX3532776.1 hypothetical protein [Streptomyces sp. ID05-39B]
MRAVGGVEAAAEVGPLEVGEAVGRGAADADRGEQALVLLHNFQATKTAKKSYSGLCFEKKKKKTHRT